MKLPNVEDIYPLTPVQQGMLFHTLYAPDAGLYCVQLSFLIEGDLVPAALREAWQQVLARHPILRTAFLWEGLEQPLQVVHEQLDLPWREEDWSALDPDEQNRRWDECLDADRRQGFTLGQAPLLRLALIRISPRAYRFLWNHHHLLLDGWSSSLVYKDVQVAYDACRRGAAGLPQAPRPYRDYLAWLPQQDLAQAEEFWREVLRGYRTPMRLPLNDIPDGRPVAVDGDGSHKLSLPADATVALQDFARRQQVSLNVVVQAAWALMLSRYSGDDDVIFGITLSGRPPALAGIESMVGLFINTLPMRVQATPDATVAAWLKHIQARQGDLQQYEHTSLLQVQSWSEMPAATPLFESLFVFENYPISSAGDAGPAHLVLRDIRARDRTNYPLSAVALPGPQLRLELLYDGERIDPELAARMLQHWANLLLAMIADPRQRLAQVTMLSDAELRRAVTEWNDTARPYPRDASIPALFEAQSQLTPDAPAVVWGTQRLSYAALDRRANQMARYLQSAGARDGNLVGLHLQRGPDMVVAMMAILKTGCAYVPLDTAYPAERLAMMVRDCGAEVVLTQRDLLANLDGGDARLVAIDALRDEFDRLSDDSLALPSDAERLAYVIYTSGSTGIPKGVAVPHRAVVRLVRNSDFVQLGPADRVAQASNASFDAATFEIWGALLNGGALVGVERDVTLSPRRLAEFLRAERITTYFLTTALFNQIAHDVPDAFASVRHVLFGGEAVDPQSVRRVLEAGRPERLLHVYGPTENTTFSTWHLVDDVAPGAATVPIGRAIANSQLYVLDPQMRPAPVGVPGELYLGGDGVAHGYLNCPELTAERFVPDPFSARPDARLYRSGDVVRYRHDGAIEFVGRIDNQIKIRGFRVELGEIEAALASHPSVRQAVVIHAANRLAAYVVAAPGASPERRELRRHLAQTLPDYMIPADVAVLDRLPLNPNGKVDRALLPEIARTPDEDDAAPGTATEEIVAAIWAKTLGLDAVGTASNFFELGGHSLLATRVISRLREAFGIELPLRLLFQSPTVAGLSEHIAAMRRQATPPPPAIRRAAASGPLALSFAQERLWFLHQLEPGNPFYNVPLALSLQGRLDVRALRASIDAVVRRHEVLRATFADRDGGPVQLVAATWTIDLPVVDLSGLPESIRAGQADHLIADEARKPFDLAACAPLRTRLLRLAPDHHVLLFTMHHIVADGWSLGVLVNELAPLYRAHWGAEAPLEPPLPELPIQYSDFAAWQRDWLRGEVLDTQLTYWKTRLGDAPPVLDLPTDRPRPPIQSYQGSSVHFRIDAAVADALRRLSRRSELTLFMTLLSGFATLLYRYSGQNDMVIGSPIANRNRGEIEPLVGFFANTLALRIDLAGTPTFEELLGRIREIALDAYAHQDLPFEKLVDELQPERDLSLNPLFQVMFALQNAPIQRLDLPELSAELMEPRHQTALFDLVLDMWEADGTLCGVLEYNTDLFEESSVQRIVRNLQTLLASIAADPVCRLDDLACLTPHEQDGLLRMGSGPRRDYPVSQTLHELFAQTALRDPSRIAAVHNGARITYGALDARSNRIAHRLRALGVTPNDFVGILDHRGIDVLAAMLGILKAGAAFVPLDPAYPSERLRHMLTDSGVRVLITRTTLLAELPAGLYGGQTILLDRNDWLDEPDSAPSSVSGAGDLAYMLYTSGSTGLPKGAMVRHDGAVNHIFAEFELLGFHPGTAFLQSAPSSSDISVWQFLAPVLIGGRTVVADYETVCDPAALFRLIRSQDITLIELVPVVMKDLLDHVGHLSPQDRALPRLACAMVTGEAATPALINQWLATYPAVTLINAYGPTEAADDICQGVLDRPLASDRVALPIGRPLANLTLYVLDRHLRLVPWGVPGEICVSGIQVGAGYWRDDARTRASFVANPHAGDGRGDVIYRTGDLGRWLPDGTLECLKRIDHQIKLRGFRIELGEIEGVLSAHPTVREAVVAIRDDSQRDHHLAAYVVPDPASAEVCGHLDDLRREQIGLWQDLHEDSYQDELLRGDPTFNVIGWDSNYTGSPLPEADMREYVGFTVERIVALQPRHVLEIGCGTGLIMFPLLPHCASYAGVDLSNVAIRRLRDLQQQSDLRARIAGLEQAELSCRRADDADWIESGRYDTVVLPSVVQYFPGIDYVLQVLDNIFTRALAPGGSVFIGDVRSLPLLEAFHASVQLHKAAPSDHAGALAGRVRRRLAQEQELAIDPTFFLALRQRFPAISHVEILPKRGSHLNEMTRFRYDVVIRTGGTSTAVADLPWTEWRHRRPGLDVLARLLAEKPPVLALRGVSNQRVQEALATAGSLFSRDGDRTADEVRTSVAEPARGALEPEDLWRLGRDFGYRVDLSLAAGYRDGGYDAVFRRSDGNSLPALSWGSDGLLKPWIAYANNPLQEKLGRRMAPLLREVLKQKLPLYMVPSSITLLSHLPVTPAGKLDRQSLPAPDLSERMADGAYVAPRTREEQALARIWADILGLTRVGIHNNFFELGGHSLKATQVISRIHRELGIQVPLRELFSRPTIAELAPRLVSVPTTALAAIPRAPDAEHYPLSHAQRRLWVLAQIEGASAAYNMPIALLLEGPLDLDAFSTAYAGLVERHESLRTVFVVIDGVPRQRILPAAGSRLAVVDLTGAPHPEDAARELALADAAGPFDLERNPVRASLLVLAAHRFVLLLNIHHIVSDDRSLDVFMSEFVQLYAARSRGTDAALPPLAVQYRDYASWQHDFLAGDAVAAHRDYWHRKLAGDLPALDLPTDLPRPPIQTYRGQTLSFRVGAEQFAALSTLARERHASAFMALVALVKVLLYRHTGQDEIVLGFPISGRTHSDLENQIGFYVNTLPLRDRVRGNDSFLEFLDAVRITATEAYEHQAYPFDRLVDELNVARDVSRSPMFDVIVVMQNAAAPGAVLDGITVDAFVRKYEIAKFDLSFTFEERRDGELQAHITYNTDLFLPARINRMAGHIRELVASILRDPTQSLARLPMLDAAERRQVLALGIPATPSSPRVETLTRLFERQAALNPESLALILPAGGNDDRQAATQRQSMSYGELNSRANRLAHHLRRLGVGPDVLVGLCLPRSLDLVVGMLGILKAGGAYLPLDPAHPAERWAYMMGDAGATTVVMQQALADTFTDPELRTICLDRDAATLAAEPANNPPPVANADHLAYVIYTSGSTGRPKGVAVTHRNVVRLFTTSEPLFGFGAQDVWTLFHSFAFDFSVWELWGALLYGGRAVIVPHAASRSPQNFYDLLVREGVTVLNQTPSAFGQLIPVEDDPDIRRSLALRHVIFGGETLEFNSLRPWFDRHGDAEPRLVNMYGITETTVHVTFRALTVADLDVSGSRIGPPLPDMKLYLLDANRQPVPIGVTGELYVGGPGVAKGYLNRPDLTADRFIADPFDPDPTARLYRSGDLARFRVADNDIEYLGRIDHQVQIRGFRVELGEIEETLRACPGIAKAVVLAHGQGAHMRLVGYFVGAGESPSAGAVRRHLQASLPDYMIPAALIAVPAFPLTGNGKLDRVALLALEGSRPEVDVAYTAPADEMERLLVSLFQEALGIDRVGVHDNFFELGANSLLLVQVHRRLRERLQHDIAVVRLFQYPTVSALARELAGQPSAAQHLDPQPARDRGARRRAARDKRNSASPQPLTTVDGDIR